MTTTPRGAPDPALSPLPQSCAEHPFAGSYLILTPDLIHYGKFVCPKCERFLAWAKHPEGTTPRRRTYVVGGVKFNSKTALIDYTKETLAGAAPGQALSGERFAVVRELLDYHPEAEQKIGPGIARIEVRANPEFGRKARGFWLVRTDGTETDFSYRKCMEGGRAYRNKFIHTCRYAIKEHVEEFKDKFFQVAINPTCPLTGLPLTPQNSHVDHIPPHTFERIVQAFAVLNALNIDDPNLCENGVDGMMLPTFTSELIRDKFVYFHNAHAQLRVISADANTSLVPAFVRQTEVERV